MLEAWRALSDPSDRIIACFGDSTTEGVVNISNGGYTQVLRELMWNTWGCGGFGFYGTWREHWTFSSGADAWNTSQGGASHPWNIGPMDGGTFDVNTKVVIGNGATRIATWNKLGGSGATSSPPAGSFTLWVVDSTGSGTFSYSVDAGPWVNVTGSWSNNNSLVHITINTPIESNIRVRAADSSSTATMVYLVGIEPHAESAGAKVHNIGANSEFSFSAIRSLPGWGSWLDIVKPKIATIMFTNDLALWDQTAYQNRMQTFVDRVKANNGEPVIMTMCGQSGRNPTNYSQQRAANQNVADANNLIHINFYDIMGDFAAASAAGYMADNLHPNNKGAQVIAQHIWSCLGATGSGPRVRATTSP